jgi:hypothetical protein
MAGISRENSMFSIPVLRSFHSATTRPDGSRTVVRVNVVDRQFGPIPEEEFTVQKLLTGAVECQTIAVGSPENEASRRWDWYQLPLALGALSLVAGLVLLPGARGRASPGHAFES